MITHKGFGLLELLVAMAVFAIIMMVAYRGLSGTMASYQSLNQEFRQLSQLQLAMQILEQDMVQITARSAQAPDGSQRPALASPDREGDLLQFTRGGVENPMEKARSSLQRVGYRWQQQQLIRFSWISVDPARDQVSQQTVLLKSVEQLQLRFLDHQDQWQSRWPATDQSPPLPKAVEWRWRMPFWGSLRRVWILPQNFMMQS